MTNEMIQIVTERVNEMTKNVEIQKMMMSFSSTEEAQDWIIKAAIATLVISKN